MESALSTQDAKAPAEGSSQSLDPRLAVDAKVAWIVALSLAAVIASARQVIERQPDHGFFVPTLAWIVIGTAAWLDVSYRRIPNALTYPAILLGLAFNVLVPALSTEPVFGPNVLLSWLGGTTATDGIKGFGVFAAFGIFSFMVRGVGGGDAKVLGAFGALVGFSQGLPAVFNCLLIGAFISVTNLLLQGALIRKLQSLGGSILAAVVLKQRPEHVQVFATREAPFVLALFLGLVTSQFIHLHRYVFFFLETGP